MTKEVSSGQDRFLAGLVQHGKKVAISLLSGIKIEGKIVAFDQFSVLVEDGTGVFIFKHAISSLRAVEPGVVESTERPAAPVRKRIQLRKKEPQ
jgi:host factor-I protein